MIARSTLVKLLSVIIFFVAWELMTANANRLFIAPPTEIIAAGYQLFIDGAIIGALFESLEPLAIALFISIVGGILIGVLMAEIRIVEWILDPFVTALYAIPRVALIPLIILWFGLETTGKVSIITSIAIFPVIINTFSGLRDVRANLIDIGRAFCATRTQIFFKITLPASVPYIMAGVRLSIGLAIIGMVVAELFTAVSGLGGMMIFFANSFATAKLFVPIIVVAFLGVVLTEIARRLEDRFSAWRIAEKERE